MKEKLVFIVQNHFIQHIEISRGADALQAPKLIKMSGRGNLRKQIFQLSGRRLKPFVIYPQTMIAPGPFQTPAGIVQLSKNHRTRGGTAKLCIIRHPVLRPAKQHISAALSADPRQKNVRRVSKRIN